MNYFVKPVVCDYGVFRLENDGTHKLIEICNAGANAERIAEILNTDSNHEVWNGGEWGRWVVSEVRCPNCLEYFDTDCYSTGELNKCPNCGADMRERI